MWIQRLRAVMTKEWHHILRDKRTLTFVLLVPAFELALYGYAIKVDVKHLPTAVFNEDTRKPSRDLVNAFATSNYFDIEKYLTSASDIQTTLDQGKIRACLHIPPDFSKRLLRRESAQLQLLVDGTDPNPAQAALSNSAMIVNAFESKFHGTLIQIGATDFRPRLWYNPDLRSSWFMVPGLLGIILMLLVPAMTANAIVREKEGGNLEQLLVTPIRPYEFIIGKIIPYIVVGLFIVASIVLSAWLLFSVPVRGPLIALFGLSLLFLLGCLSMGILLSTLAENQNQANQMIMFAAIPSILLSGFIFPRESMPSFAYLIGYAIPMTYFLKILRGVLLKGMGFVALWDQIWPLLIFASAMIGMSILKFRKKLG